MIEPRRFTDEQLAVILECTVEEVAHLRGRIGDEKLQDHARLGWALAALSIASRDTNGS